MAVFGALRSTEATFVEYIYLTEAGLNQLGFEVGGSGFTGTIDDVSVQEVGIISLGTHPALNIAVLLSPTIAPQLNITATTVDALFGKYSGAGFQGVVVEYILLPASGLNQFGLQIGPTGFVGTIDDFSIQEVGILSLDFHPGLLPAAAASQTFTTNCNVSPKFFLAVAGAVSGAVTSNLNLQQAYHLAVDDMFSISIMTEASVASSVNVADLNFRKVKLKWVDWRYPAVYLGDRQLGGFQA